MTPVLLHLQSPANLHTLHNLSHEPVKLQYQRLWPCKVNEGKESDFKQAHGHPVEGLLSTQQGLSSGVALFLLGETVPNLHTQKFLKASFES